MSDRWEVRECREHGIFNAVRLVCPRCFTDLSERFTVVRQRPVDENAPGKVSAAHGETARLAALQAMPNTGTLRAGVLDLIRASGQFGLTRDKIAQYLGRSPNSVRPRVKELLDGGHIFVAPWTRSENGRLVEVLICEQFRNAAHESYRRGEA
jgi:hypothetical protein